MSSTADVVVTRLNTVKPERVVQYWLGRIFAGKVNVLDGDPGLGKTTALLDIGARGTTDQPMPDNTPCGRPGAFVVLTAEDGIADTIVPRLTVAGANLSQCVTVTMKDGSADRPLSIPGDVDVLEEAIRDTGATLAMVDPLMAFFGGEVNSSKDQDVRRALAQLAAVAERTGAAIVCIRHLTKMAGSNPLYRGGGSIGIIGAARSALLVAQHPDNDDLRVLAVNKNNLTLHPPALVYRLESTDMGVARVVWEGTTEYTARSLLAPPVAEEAEVSGALADAKHFLETILAGGPVPVTSIRAEAKAAGISDRTLDRAKERMPIRAKKQGQGPWTWELAPKDAKDAKDANSAKVEEHGVLRPEGKSANGSYHGSLGALGALGAVPPNGHGCQRCTLPTAPGSLLCVHCLAAGRRPEEAHR